MKKAYKNMILALKNPATWVVFFIALIAMQAFYYYTTDYELLRGNFGFVYYMVTLLLSLGISLLFGLSAGMLWYRGKLFQKDSGAVAGGSILGMLVGGCSACSISFASAIGLGGLLSWLPFGGIELKVLAFGILAVTTYSLATNLHECRRR